MPHCYDAGGVFKLGFGMVRILLGLTMFLVVGCDAIYSAPQVLKGATAGQDVHVKTITPQSLLVANNTPFKPRQLPAAFYATSGGPGALGSLGALPSPPLDPNGDPVRPTMNLPPELPSGTYRIGVGDALSLATRASASLRDISGITAENLRQIYSVQDDGTIGIPDAGRVAVAGMTIDEAESAVFQALVRANIDPSLSLEVADYRSQQVAVGGAVHNAAVILITQKPLTLVEAMSSVGGITATDRKYSAIRIYRDGIIYQVPLAEYDRRSELQRLRLTGSDSVFVDEAYDYDRAQAYFTQQIQLIGLRRAARADALNALNAAVQIRRTALMEAQGNFRAQEEFGAVRRDHVYLAGEVSRQSRLAMPFGNGLSLADALFGEGGYDQITGDSSQIYVLRGTPNASDKVTAWHLDATSAANFVLATRFELRPSDVVFVSQQPVTRWNRAIAQMLPTLSLGRQTQALAN